MEKIFIDASGGQMGRVGSFAAKNALQGKEAVILNSEKAIVSGRRENIVSEFKKIRALNLNKPEKGPFISKNPEKIMKRAIRGMLPDFRIGRGRVAWKKIRCYIGVPEEFKNEKMIKIKSDKVKKGLTLQELNKIA
jgi:ribosomal protein uL13